MTPSPVIPCIQAGSTFKSSPDGPRVCPVFSWKWYCISQVLYINYTFKSYMYCTYECFYYTCIVCCMHAHNRTLCIRVPACGISCHVMECTGMHTYIIIKNNSCIASSSLHSKFRNGPGSHQLKSLRLTRDHCLLQPGSDGGVYSFFTLPTIFCCVTDPTYSHIWKANMHYGSIGLWIRGMLHAHTPL